MRNKFGVGIVTVLVALGLLRLTACKSKTAGERAAENAVEKAIERTTGQKTEVDLKAGKIKVKTAGGEGEFSAGEKEWPNDLPEGIPPFKMGKIKGISKSTEPDHKSWVIILEDIEAGAMAKYQDALKAGGWTVASSISTGEGGVVQATKDKVMVMLTVNTEDKSGSVTVRAQIE